MTSSSQRIGSSVKATFRHALGAFDGPEHFRGALLSSMDGCSSTEREEYLVCADFVQALKLQQGAQKLAGPQVDKPLLGVRINDAQQAYLGSALEGKSRAEAFEQWCSVRDQLVEMMLSDVVAPSNVAGQSSRAGSLISAIAVTRPGVEANEVPSSFVVPSHAVMLHYWRSRTAAHAFIEGFQRCAQACLELALQGIGVPFSALYIFADGKIVTATALPPVGGLGDVEAHPPVGGTSSFIGYQTALMCAALHVPQRLNETMPLVVGVDGRFYVACLRAVLGDQNRVRSIWYSTCRPGRLIRQKLLDVHSHHILVNKGEGTSAHEIGSWFEAAALPQCVDAFINLANAALSSVAPAEAATLPLATAVPLLHAENVVDAACRSIGMNKGDVGRIAGHPKLARLVSLRAYLLTFMVGSTLKEMIRFDIEVQLKRQKDQTISDANAIIVDVINRATRHIVAKDAAFYRAHVIPVLLQKYGLEADSSAFAFAEADDVDGNQSLECVAAAVVHATTVVKMMGAAFGCSFDDGRFASVEALLKIRTTAAALAFTDVTDLPGKFSGVCETVALASACVDRSLGDAAVAKSLVMSGLLERGKSEEVLAAVDDSEARVERIGGGCASSPNRSDALRLCHLIELRQRLTIPAERRFLQDRHDAISSQVLNTFVSDNHLLAVRSAASLKWRASTSETSQPSISPTLIHHCFLKPLFTFCEGFGVHPGHAVKHHNTLTAAIDVLVNIGKEPAAAANFPIEVTSACLAGVMQLWTTGPSAGMINEGAFVREQQLIEAEQGVIQYAQQLRNAADSALQDDFVTLVRALTVRVRELQSSSKHRLARRALLALLLVTYLLRASVGEFLHAFHPPMDDLFSFFRSRYMAITAATDALESDEAKIYFENVCTDILRGNNRRENDRVQVMYINVVALVDELLFGRPASHRISVLKVQRVMRGFGSRTSLATEWHRVAKQKMWKPPLAPEMRQSQSPLAGSPRWGMSASLASTTIIPTSKVSPSPPTEEKNSPQRWCNAAYSNWGLLPSQAPVLGSINHRQQDVIKVARSETYVAYHEAIAASSETLLGEANRLMTEVLVWAAYSARSAAGSGSFADADQRLSKGYTANNAWQQLWEVHPTLQLTNWARARSSVSLNASRLEFPAFGSQSSMNPVLSRTTQEGSPHSGSATPTTLGGSRNSPWGDEPMSFWQAVDIERRKWEHRAAELVAASIRNANDLPRGFVTGPGKETKVISSNSCLFCSENVLLHVWELRREGRLFQRCIGELAAFVAELGLPHPIAVPLSIAVAYQTRYITVTWLPPLAGEEPVQLAFGSVLAQIPSLFKALKRAGGGANDVALFRGLDGRLYLFPRDPKDVFHRRIALPLPTALATDTPQFMPQPNSKNNHRDPATQIKDLFAFVNRHLTRYNPRDPAMRMDAQWLRQVFKDFHVPMAMLYYFLANIEEWCVNSRAMKRKKSVHSLRQGSNNGADRPASASLENDDVSDIVNSKRMSILEEELMVGTSQRGDAEKSQAALLLPEDEEIVRIVQTQLAARALRALVEAVVARQRRRMQSVAEASDSDRATQIASVVATIMRLLLKSPALIEKALSPIVIIKFGAPSGFVLDPKHISLSSVVSIVNTKLGLLFDGKSKVMGGFSIPQVLSVASQPTPIISLPRLSTAGGGTQQSLHAVWWYPVVCKAVHNRISTALEAARPPLGSTIVPAPLPPMHEVAADLLLLLHHTFHLERSMRQVRASQTLASPFMRRTDDTLVSFDSAKHLLDVAVKLWMDGAAARNDSQSATATAALVYHVAAMQYHYIGRESQTRFSASIRRVSVAVTEQSPFTRQDEDDVVVRDRVTEALAFPGLARRALEHYSSVSRQAKVKFFSSDAGPREAPGAKLSLDLRSFPCDAVFVAPFLGVLVQHTLSWSAEESKVVPSLARHAPDSSEFLGSSIGTSSELLKVLHDQGFIFNRLTADGGTVIIPSVELGVDVFAQAPLQNGLFVSWLNCVLDDFKFQSIKEARLGSVGFFGPEASGSTVPHEIFLDTRQISRLVLLAGPGELLPPTSPEHQVFFSKFFSIVGNAAGVASDGLLGFASSRAAFGDAPTCVDDAQVHFHLLELLASLALHYTTRVLAVAATGEFLQDAEVERQLGSAATSLADRTMPPLVHLLLTAPNDNSEQGKQSHRAAVNALVAVAGMFNLATARSGDALSYAHSDGSPAPTEDLTNFFAECIAMATDLRHWANLATATLEQMRRDRAAKELRFREGSRSECDDYPACGTFSTSHQADLFSCVSVSRAFHIFESSLRAVVCVMQNIKEAALTFGGAQRHLIELIDLAAASLPHFFCPAVALLNDAQDTCGIDKNDILLLKLLLPRGSITDGERDELLLIKRERAAAAHRQRQLAALKEFQAELEDQQVLGRQCVVVDEGCERHTLCEHLRQSSWTVRLAECEWGEHMVRQQVEECVLHDIDCLVSQWSEARGRALIAGESENERDVLVQTELLGIEAALRKTCSREEGVAWCVLVASAFEAQAAVLADELIQQHREAAKFAANTDEEQRRALMHRQAAADRASLEQDASSQAQNVADGEHAARLRLQQQLVTEAEHVVLAIAAKQALSNSESQLRALFLEDESQKWCELLEQQSTEWCDALSSNQRKLHKERQVILSDATSKYDEIVGEELSSFHSVEEAMRHSLMAMWLVEEERAARTSNVCFREEGERALLCCEFDEESARCRIIMVEHEAQELIQSQASKHRAEVSSIAEQLELVERHECRERHVIQQVEEAVARAEIKLTFSFAHVQATEADVRRATETVDEISSRSAISESFNDATRRLLQLLAEEEAWLRHQRFVVEDEEYDFRLLLAEEQRIARCDVLEVQFRKELQDLQFFDGNSPGQVKVVSLNPDAPLNSALDVLYRSSQRLRFFGRALEVALLCDREVEEEVAKETASLRQVHLGLREKCSPMRGGRAHHDTEALCSLRKKLAMLEGYSADHRLQRLQVDEGVQRDRIAQSHAEALVLLGDELEVYEQLARTREQRRHLAQMQASEVPMNFLGNPAGADGGAHCVEPAQRSKQQCRASCSKQRALSSCHLGSLRSVQCSFTKDAALPPIKKISPAPAAGSASAVLKSLREELEALDDVSEGCVASADGHRRKGRSHKSMKLGDEVGAWPNDDELRRMRNHRSTALQMLQQCGDSSHNKLSRPSILPRLASAPLHRGDYRPGALASTRSAASPDNHYATSSHISPIIADFATQSPTPKLMRQRIPAPMTDHLIPTKAGAVLPCVAHTAISIHEMKLELQNEILITELRSAGIPPSRLRASTASRTRKVDRTGCRSEGLGRLQFMHKLLDDSQMQLHTLGLISAHLRYHVSTLYVRSRAGRIILRFCQWRRHKRKCRTRIAGLTSLRRRVLGDLKERYFCTLRDKFLRCRRHTREIASGALVLILEDAFDREVKARQFQRSVSVPLHINIVLERWYRGAALRKRWRVAAQLQGCTERLTIRHHFTALLNAAILRKAAKLQLCGENRSLQRKMGERRALMALEMFRFQLRVVHRVRQRAFSAFVQAYVRRAKRHELECCLRNAVANARASRREREFERVWALINDQHQTSDTSPSEEDLQRRAWRSWREWARSCPAADNTPLSAS